MMLLDVVRGVSILLMIQVHIMELFAQPEISSGWAGKVSLFLGGTPAAPIFLVIMGFLSYSKNSALSDNVFRGFKLIIWGLLLNVGLNLNLIYHVYFQNWEINIYHYIFGVDILPTAGLSFIALALIPQKYKNNGLLMIGLIFIVFIIGSFHFTPNESFKISYLAAFITGGTSWSYFPFFPWFAYPLIGYLVASHKNIVIEFAEKENRFLLASVVIILFLYLTWEFASNITHVLPAYYHHGFDFYLWSLVFMALIFIVTHYFLKTVNFSIAYKYLGFLSKNITAVYVFQWLIIGNLATWWFQQFNILKLVISFVVITILSSLLTFAWQKIKYKLWKQKTHS